MQTRRGTSLGLLLCAGMAGACAGSFVGLLSFNDHIFAPALAMVAGGAVAVAVAVLVLGAPRLPPVRPAVRPVVRARRAIPLRRVPAVRISAAARRPGAGVMTLPAHPSQVADRVDPIGHLLPERVRPPSGSRADAPALSQPGPSPAASRPRPPAIDVNSAGIEELSRLPGVGPAAAGRIVTHRQARGPFGAVADLADVDRFTAQRVARLAPRAAANPPAPALRAVADSPAPLRTCPVCGEDVTNPRATYCTPSCRQAASRARRREQAPA